MGFTFDIMMGGSQRNSEVLCVGEDGSWNVSRSWTHEKIHHEQSQFLKSRISRFSVKTSEGLKSAYVNHLE